MAHHRLGHTSCDASLGLAEVVDPGRPPAEEHSDGLLDRDVDVPAHTGHLTKAQGGGSGYDGLEAAGVGGKVRPRLDGFPVRSAGDVELSSGGQQPQLRGLVPPHGPALPEGRD